MHRRRAFSALPGLLFVVAALSGCLTDDGGDGDQDPDVDRGAPSADDTAEPPASGSGTGNRTSDDPENGTGDETGNETGTPPTADLTEDVANNTAPANVTFRVDATEPDGDALEWTLEWDGNGSVEEGTEVPATVNVTYEEPGNYTATLTVTDKDGSDTATVNITIVSGTTGLAMCHRPDATAAGPFWVDDRGGGGLWVYEESNDVEGLQVGGDQAALAGGHQDEEFLDCEDADTLVF